MKPRLPSSKKWTPFPEAYVSQIEQVFKDAFSAPLAEGQLFIEGRIYPEEIVLRVGYLQKGRLLQNNFEVSTSHSPTKHDAVERIHNCIDAAASMMNEFIASDGEVDFPRSWKNYEFSGQEIWVQYTTDNTALESEADRLLGLSKKSLVEEEDDSVDALAGAVVIPIENDHDFSEQDIEPDEDDSVKSPRPSLFSGKSKKSKKTRLH